MKLKTAIAHMMADATPSTVAGMVDQLGGTKAAAQAIGVSQRSIERYLKAESGGPGQKRNISAEKREKLGAAAARAKVDKNGVLVGGEAELIDPSGEPATREINDPDTGGPIELSGDDLGDFLDALAAGNMDLAEAAFDAAVMDAYGFGNAHFDAGGSAIPAGFTMTVLD